MPRRRGAAPGPLRQQQQHGHGRRPQHSTLSASARRSEGPTAEPKPDPDPGPPPDQAAADADAESSGPQSGFAARRHAAPAARQTVARGTASRHRNATASLPVAEVPDADGEAGAGAGAGLGGEERQLPAVFLSGRAVSTGYLTPELLLLPPDQLEVGRRREGGGRTWGLNRWGLVLHGGLWGAARGCGGLRGRHDQGGRSPRSGRAVPAYHALAEATAAC